MIKSLAIKQACIFIGFTLKEKNNKKTTKQTKEKTNMAGHRQTIVSAVAVVGLLLGCLQAAIGDGEASGEMLHRSKRDVIAADSQSWVDAHNVLRQQAGSSNMKMMVNIKSGKFQTYIIYNTFMTTFIFTPVGLLDMSGSRRTPVTQPVGSCHSPAMDEFVRVSLTKCCKRYIL